MGATEVSDKEAREDCTEWHILLPENESLVFLEASMGLIHHVYRWIRVIFASLTLLRMRQSTFDICAWVMSAG